MLAAIHFLHLAAGIAWAGGTLMWTLAIAPALARMEPASMRTTHAALRPWIGNYLTATGLLLIVTGIVRIHAGGMVTSFADLATSYAIHAMAALAALVVLAVVEQRYQAGIARILGGSADPGPGMRRFVRRMSLGTIAGLALIVALMTALGLGYY